MHIMFRAVIHFFFLHRSCYISRFPGPFVPAAHINNNYGGKSVSSANITNYIMGSGAKLAVVVTLPE